MPQACDVLRTNDPPSKAGGFTRDKSLPALRAFVVLRIDACSLFWRNAAAAVPGRVY